MCSTFSMQARSQRAAKNTGAGSPSTERTQGSPAAAAVRPARRAGSLQAPAPAPAAPSGPLRSCAHTPCNRPDLLPVSCKPSPRAACSALTDQAAQLQITDTGRNQPVTKKPCNTNVCKFGRAHCCRPLSAAAAPRSCQTIPPARAVQNSRSQPCPRTAQLQHPSWGLSRLYATNIAGAGTPARHSISCAGTVAACSCHLGGWPNRRPTHQHGARKATGNPLAAPKERLATRHQTGTCASGRAGEAVEPQEAPIHRAKQLGQSSLSEERAARLKTPIMIG